MPTTPVKQRGATASGGEPSTGAAGGQQQPPSQKRQVPPPSSFTDIAMALILHVCRKYLFYDMTYKIGFYVLFVTILSFFGDLAPLPRNFYLATKRNVLNDYFVKWGLLWTLAFLSPFVYYTAKVYSGGDIRNIRQQMARLIVSVVVWFLSTTVFGHVERISGFCTKSAYPDRSACAVGGGRWLSFDVSGHAFLLIYCCLVIAEESRVYRNWDRIADLLDRARVGSDPIELLAMSEREKSNVRESYTKYTFWIRLGFLGLSGLHLLWDFMLAITALYYHNFAQKIVGVAVATGVWYLTYGLWYRSKHSPGMPGHGKMKYQKKE